MKFDASLYNEDDIKSLANIDEALNKYEYAHIGINILYYLSFLINNEFINIDDSDKLQEDNVTPLWCLPQYEEYFVELRNILLSTNNRDLSGNMFRGYSYGDVRLMEILEDDDGCDCAFLPSIKIFDKEIIPISGFSYLKGFFFKDNLDLDDDAYIALCHLFMNEELANSLYQNFPIFNNKYQTDTKYRFLKDGVNSRIFLQYGQLKEYSAILRAIQDCLFYYNTFGDHYAQYFVY